MLGMPSAKRLLRISRWLADLALPGGCVGCAAWLAPGEGPWCVRCALALGQTAQRPYCHRCALTLMGPADGAGCPVCIDQGSRIEGFCRIGEYDGHLQQLICRYKFARQQNMDRALGAYLCARLQDQAWASELDAIVPVPSSWRTQWAYGFTPSVALADELARGIALPVLPLLYERGKRRRQVGLTPEERRRNVRGVYHLRRGARPAGGIFCIVDDVSTTGSTVQEVARVLLQAGALRVYVAVLAKTHPDRAHALQA